MRIVRKRAPDQQGRCHEFSVAPLPGMEETGSNEPAVTVWQTQTASTNPVPGSATGRFATREAPGRADVYVPGYLRLHIPRPACLFQLLFGVMI